MVKIGVEEMQEDQDRKDHDDDGEERIDFQARLNNANIITTGLRGIANGKREQHVRVEVLQDCLQFITTDSTKALQGSALISEKLFEEWQIAAGTEQISFRVNLAVLLDCITMGTGTSLTTSTGLKLEYSANQGTLKLQLIEIDYVTECVIRTLMDDETDDQALDFSSAFKNAELVGKGAIASERFRDALAELSELPGASLVMLTLDSASPVMMLSAEGDSGVCFVKFQIESFLKFECTKPVTFSYKLSLLERASKALSEADKTFLRVNSEGILSVQNLFMQPDSQKTFVDFFILACEDLNDAGGADERDELQGD